MSLDETFLSHCPNNKKTGCRIKASLSFLEDDELKEILTHTENILLFRQKVGVINKKTIEETRKIRDEIFGVD